MERRPSATMPGEVGRILCSRRSGWRGACHALLLAVAALAHPRALAGVAPAAPVAPEPTEAARDELPEAGYLPGYRTYPSLGLSSYAPMVGALPGGITPGFMAPMPAGAWTLRFSGYFSASAQFSTNDRPLTSAGQHTLVFHAPPGTIEEYASFVSTSSVPGHWVQMLFDYGNREVSAVVMLSTWNPSEPTTYYQMGSQNFINSVYLDYRIPEPRRGLKLSVRVGYFYTNYGSLGEYNLGMYQNPIAAIVRGVGITGTAEYRLGPRLGLIVEEGVLGNRNGKAPSGLTRQGPNVNTDPTLPAAYVEHAHLGLLHRGDRATVRAGLHYILNWAMDDRPQVAADDMVTRCLDESYLKDARLSIYAGELNLSHTSLGTLAMAASHLDASNACTLRGVQSFGGEGQTLTDRWLGDETSGTGTLNVLGLNYTGALRRLLAPPGAVPANRPDLIINAGFILAESHGANPLFGGRIRHKAGLDLLYVIAAWVGAGLRVDRVAPNSRDAGETFYVLAPRLVFKTDWGSRENISLMYAKWFYGPRSHMEYSAVLPPRLDDQLFALNVNMWW